MVGLSFCEKWAETFALASDLRKISGVLDHVIGILKIPVTAVPVDQIPLWKPFSDDLANLRKIWNLESPSNPEEMSGIQKRFSDGSLKLVLEILEDSVKLVGGPPNGKFALLLLGSSSRQDRLPFSDIELALIYSGNSGDFKNLEDMRIFLYLLMTIFEFAILRLQETHGIMGMLIPPPPSLLPSPSLSPLPLLSLSPLLPPSSFELTPLVRIPH
jgi:hypothetical protein